MTAFNGICELSLDQRALDAHVLADMLATARAQFERLFVRSLGGVCHTKEDDTPDADLELSVRALYELTRRTLAWAAGERSG